MAFVTLLLFCTTITSAQLLRKSTLDGQHLAVPAIEIPPQLYIDRDSEGNWAYRGMTKDIMDLLAERLNFSYTFINVDPSNIRKDGQKLAMIRMLVRKEVDLLPYGILLSPDLLNYADFSTTVGLHKIVLLIPYPKEDQQSLSALVKPFSLKVWILLTLSFITTAIVLTFISRHYSVDGNRLAFVDDLNDMFMYIIYTTLGQSSCYLAVDRFSLRIVVAAWSLVAIVYLYSYKGILLSFMTVPIMTPMVSSFDDLAHQNELSLLIEANSIGAKMIQNVNKSSYRLIAKSLREKPDNFYKTEEELLRKMMTGKYAHITTDLQANYYINDMLTTKGQCTFTTTDTDDFNTNYISFHYVLPKNGPYNQLLNTEIQKLSDYGQLDFFVKRYNANVDKCFKRWHKKSPLTLYEMIGPFVLLVVGVTVSLVVFLIEKRRARKRTTAVVPTPLGPADKNEL